MSREELERKITKGTTLSPKMIDNDCYKVYQMIERNDKNEMIGAILKSRKDEMREINKLRKTKLYSICIWITGSMLGIAISLFI